MSEENAQNIEKILALPNEAEHCNDGLSIAEIVKISKAKRELSLAREKGIRDFEASIAFEEIKGFMICYAETYSKLCVDLLESKTTLIVSREAAEEMLKENIMNLLKSIGKMLQNGVSIDYIHQITGLDKEKIKDIVRVNIV